MPKIKFDLDQVNYTEFRTKEDYDRDSYSSAGYDRWHNARNKNKPYSGPCHRYSSDPIKFPCIQIEVKTWDNPNGPYEIDCIYIYDYELIEDSDTYGHDWSVGDTVRRISGEEREMKIGTEVTIQAIGQFMDDTMSLQFSGYDTWWYANNFERIK
jgi:hypothetical protein